MNIASLPVCTEGHSNVTTVPPIRAPYGSTPLVVSQVTSSENRQLKISNRKSVIEKLKLVIERSKSIIEKSKSVVKIQKLQ